MRMNTQRSRWMEGLHGLSSCRGLDGCYLWRILGLGWNGLSVARLPDVAPVG